MGSSDAVDTNSHRQRQTSNPPTQPGGFFFGFGGYSKLLTLAFGPMRLRRHRRPQKSGSQPLFELSLQVERNNAHNPGLRVRDPAPVTDLNAHCVLKAPQESASGGTPKPPVHRPQPALGCGGCAKGRELP